MWCIRFGETRHQLQGLDLQQFVEWNCCRCAEKSAFGVTGHFSRVTVGVGVGQNVTRDTFFFSFFAQNRMKESMS